jgi:anaerobic selenocysteine-containing dehydrogenase
MTTTAYRICTLCEATCGVAVELDDDRVRTIRGDKEDPFSRGFICPKAYGLKALEEDPDRLQRPLRRTAGGFSEIGWDEAFDEAIDRLLEIRERHGSDAVATYLGNPVAHSLHAMLYGPVLQKALGTKQRYSASSVDQLPKMVSSGLMFGGGLLVPVPDVDRTDHLLVLGANPLVSNGSLMTAPDMPGRLRALRERGGKLVVIDPRRSETARVADEHHFIRPGTDALLLLSMVHVLFEEGLVRLGRAEGLVRGLDAVQAIAKRFAPEAVAARTGIDAPTIRRLAREHAAADRAACYGRIGTTCQQFGTLSSWAVDLVNILTGNLDRPGGALFTKPAANRGGNPSPGKRGRGVKLGRWTSRVRGLPETFGELPVAALADEIEGGGVHALLTIAGNPLVSAPNVERLDGALAGLDFMLSVDFYLNETTRHAHLILPPPSPLRRDTYDLALYQLAVQNVAKYSPPALPRPADHPDEWEILLMLAKGLMGMREMDLATADNFVLATLVQGEVREDGGRWPGLDASEALAALGTRPGPARMLDLFLRTGPWGDGFGRREGGLSLERLRDNPHGLVLGPLEPSLPDVLRTPDAQIDLAPELVVRDVERLEAARFESDMVLIGRRQLRSNNSWMHNLVPLVKGPERCTLLVGPDDAARLGLEDAAPARVTSRVGSVVAKVCVTDEMMPGVVSLPHGWGHDREGIRLGVAREHAGVNVNRLSDDALLDQPSANAALNGVPVRVERVD